MNGDSHQDTMKPKTPSDVGTEHNAKNAIYLLVFASHKRRVLEASGTPHARHLCIMITSAEVEVCFAREEG